jgi:primosomal protein N'
MLTDYMVNCPHCHWAGSLLPQGNRDAWKSASCSAHVITFHCPKCQGEWHARIVGDDAVPLPLDEPALPV